MPSTEETDQQQGEEHSHWPQVEGEGQQDERYEEKRLNDVHHLPEVPYPSHPRTHERLQHPRHEEERGAKRCPCRCHVQLEQHQQSNVSHHCPRYLFRGKEGEETKASPVPSKGRGNGVALTTSLLERAGERLFSSFLR